MCRYELTSTGTSRPSTSLIQLESSKSLPPFRLALSFGDNNMNY
jgi:hypothetical protein